MQPRNTDNTAILLINQIKKESSITLVTKHIKEAAFLTINGTDEKGQTPLHHACMRLAAASTFAARVDAEKIIRELLSKGARLDLHNDQMQLPADLLKTNHDLYSWFITQQGEGEISADIEAAAPTADHLLIDEKDQDRVGLTHLINLVSQHMPKEKTYRIEYVAGVAVAIPTVLLVLEKLSLLPITRDQHRNSKDGFGLPESVYVGWAAFVILSYIYMTFMARNHSISHEQIEHILEEAGKVFGRMNEVREEEDNATCLHLARVKNTIKELHQTVNPSSSVPGERTNEEEIELDERTDRAFISKKALQNNDPVKLIVELRDNLTYLRHDLNLSSHPLAFFTRANTATSTAAINLALEAANDLPPKRNMSASQ